MSHGKQFTLYSHGSGPNGWKAAIVLEELGLTYETIYLDFQKGEHKAPEYTKYNPNGRVPALIDHHNGDFVVWESGAILVYLADKYDPTHKISASDDKEKITQLQWLFFQASGQGPYFGQAAWFLHFHPEKLPSAVERYQKETIRVWTVLEGVLSKQEWLVGNKCTIADLSFIPWNGMVTSFILNGYEGKDQKAWEKEFPAVVAWHTKLTEREPVKGVLATKASMAQH